MNAETAEKEGKKGRIVNVRPATLILMAVVLLAPATLGARLNVVHADSFPSDRG